MAKALVIVESPAKVKTIAKFLDNDYTVCASMGHIIDLPKSSMGVDIEKGFEPRYTLIPKKKKIFNQLKKEAKDKEVIFLALDPDREGEAISWHLKNQLGEGKSVYRIVFNEITKKVVCEAFKNPTDIDLNKVDAQQARRILDRIVGYSLSPLLWRKIGRGLSAGRVQSVAVRFICDRENEIRSFLPQEYWSIEAKLQKQLAKQNGGSFVAKLERIEGEKPEIKSGEEAKKIVVELKNEKFIVAAIKEQKKRRYPQAPFTTSKLQQEAFNKLRFSANKTMRIAQQLYEGLEIGNEENEGLITYMRTDSVRASLDAQKETREFIAKRWGKQFLPSVSPQYKSKKGAQEAHEAIRPTSVSREPEKIKDFLTSDQYKLYLLIWNKFVTSQMKPALFLNTTVDIEAGRFLFRATGSRLIFAGFTILYGKEEGEERVLPPLSVGELLRLIELLPRQHFTEPPPRFSDASLVKLLEEKGIGRPSTYAPIIFTIVTRDYVRRISGYFHPTELGEIVTRLLVKYFPRVLDSKFTAALEEELDDVERGGVCWKEVLESFYKPFSRKLTRAEKKIKKEVISTKEICQLCGKEMVIKWGRWGRFLSCSAFPQCKNAKPISTGVRCPEKDCPGELIERRSGKGRFFYGCTNYPKCKYTSRTLPQEDS